jgi:hypothetical protein
MICKESCHFLISNVVPGQLHGRASADLDSGDTRQQSHDYHMISYDCGNVLFQILPMLVARACAIQDHLASKWHMQGIH